MPKTIQQIQAQQAALKKAMAANPNNKATQKLGASVLASTNKTLQNVQTRVSGAIKPINVGSTTRALGDAQQIQRQNQLRAGFLSGTSTPVNSINGRPSSNQLVRVQDSKGNTYAGASTGFAGAGQIVRSASGQQTVLDPATGRTYDPRSRRGKELLGATGMNSADYERSLKAAGRAAQGQNAQTGEQMSYADIGRGMIQNEYDATADAAKGLGLGETYGSLDEYIKDQAKAQAEQKALQEAKIAASEVTLEQDAQLASRQIKSQAAAAEGALLGSREGVTSNTNLKTIDRLRSNRTEQLDRLQLSIEQQQLEIEQAKRDLVRAEKSGNTALAEQYKQQIAAAEFQAKAIESDYLAAQTQQLGAESEYARTQSAIVNSGVQTFQGLVESGVEMDYSTVKGYADQLGLPADMLMGYYQGAQIIRDDKTLDQETKAIQIAQLNQDLQDQMEGLTTEAARKIDYLNQQTAQWQAMGYSPEEIASMRSNTRTMLGIEDQSDPAYLADLAYKEAQIKYSESNTAVNYQDLIQKQFEYAESMGYEGGAYIPNSTRGNKYKIQTVTSEDGSIGVQVTDSNGKPLQEGDYGGQCGAFVNDLFGASVFGDKYGDPKNIQPTDKLGKVDFSLTMPAAGMAIVLPQKGNYAKNGHVVYITSVDAVNQQINYVDSNGNGDETIGYNSMTFGELGQLIENKTGGLVVNDNSTLEGGAGVDGGNANPYSYSSFYNEAIANGITDKDAAKKYAADLFKESSTFRTDDARKSYMVYSSLDRANKVYSDTIAGMDEAQLEDYANLNNVVSKGLAEYDNEKPLTNAIINEIVDDETQRQLIRNQMDWVGAKLRGASGAAITVGEYITETFQNFPQKNDTAATVLELQDKRVDYTKSLKSSLDLHGKKLLWEAEQASLKEQPVDELDPDLEEYNSFDLYNDPEYLEGQAALGLIPSSRAGEGE